MLIMSVLLQVGLPQEAKPETDINVQEVYWGALLKSPLWKGREQDWGERKVDL